jgi:hypothetical protein
MKSQGEPKVGLFTMSAPPVTTISPGPTSIRKTVKKHPAREVSAGEAELEVPS